MNKHAELEKNSTSSSRRGITRRDFMHRSLVAGGFLALPWYELSAARAKNSLDADERKRIEAAIPTKAFDAS